MLFAQFKQPLCWIIAIFMLGLMSAQVVSAAEIKSVASKMFEHGSSSGGKGSDVLTLKAPKISGAACVVFKDATITYKKRRLGEAKIAKRPAKGCKSACKLSVSWKHAPAGRLKYQVETSWEGKSSGC